MHSLNKPTVQHLQYADGGHYISCSLSCVVGTRRPILGIQILGAVHFTNLFISMQLVAATVADAFGAFSYPVIARGSNGGPRNLGVVLTVIACTAFKLPVPFVLSRPTKRPCEPLNFDHNTVVLVGQQKRSWNQNTT